MHPLRSAVQRGASRDEFAGLFAADAVFYPPMMVKAVSGVNNILSIISLAPQIALGLNYTAEIRNENQTLLLWNGKVEGHFLEAVTTLLDNEEGLIEELKVMMRPWPVATLFRNAMYKSLADSFPAGYWDL